MNSGNKDVRKVLQQRLTETTESSMSPNFQINMNPGYTMDNEMSKTTNRTNLTGEKT